MGETTEYEGQPKELCIQKGQVRCGFCGRPVPPNLIGRPRKLHRRCSILDSMVRNLEFRIQGIIWQDKTYIAALRKRLFQAMANSFNSPSAITFMPDSDFEHEDDRKPSKKDEAKTKAKKEAA